MYIHQANHLNKGATHVVQVALKTVVPGEMIAHVVSTVGKLTPVVELTPGRVKNPGGVEKEVLARLYVAVLPTAVTVLSAIISEGRLLV